MAWVRNCITSKQPYCQDIIAKGLEGRAMVVRAEVVDLLAKRDAGTKNLQSIQALEKAFLNKWNYRNGKPMFIQQRILFAMQKIGGTIAIKRAGALANRDEYSKAYWQKIQRL